jgi:hypothetical protein
LEAWSDIVGTRGKGEKHEKRGVDVRVCFWTDGAVHRYWGVWGLKASERTEQVSDDVAAELERRLVFLVRWRLRRRAQWRDIQGRVGDFDLRRWGDGVTLYEVRPEDQERLHEWAKAAAVRRPGWASYRRREAKAAEILRRHAAAYWCDDCPGGCERPFSIEERRRPI